MWLLKKMILIFMIVKNIVYCFWDKRKIFNKLYDKICKNIEDLDNKVDRNNLIYLYKFGKEINFSKIKDPITFFNKI